MRKHIPKLSALQAFEATARHLSFTRAASELNLTQTAISHSIRDLEALLSVRLFTRGQNSIALTEEGRAYLEAIRPAIEQIAIATERVSGARENYLNILCLEAFAFKCLLPNLADFRRRHPKLKIGVTPLARLETQIPHAYDVAIWHGIGNWPGLDAQRIGEEEIFPVCSPSLLAAAKPLMKVEHLKHHVAVRTISPVVPDEWPAWTEHAGIGKLEFADEFSCYGPLLSLEAAATGLGLAIGRSQLVQQDLASGRLVEPFGIRLPAHTAYYAVSRPERAALPKVTKFRTWLLERMGA